MTHNGAEVTFKTHPALFANVACFEQMSLTTVRETQHGGLYGVYINKDGGQTTAGLERNGDGLFVFVPMRAKAPTDGVVLRPLDDGGPETAVSWLVDGYFENAAITVIYGYSQTLKSFLTLHTCLCIVAGRSWFGHDVVEGSAVYIAGEGRRGLKRRIHGWEQKYGALDTAQRERLLTLFAGDKTFSFAANDAEHLAKLVAAIERLPEPPRIVVFDTVATTFGLNEETNEAISGALKQLNANLTQRFGCSILAVHHTGKDASRGARGGYSMECDADAVYRMTRNGADGKKLQGPPGPFDWQNGSVWFECEKMKDAETPHRKLFEAQRIELGLDVLGQQISTLVLTNDSLTARQMRLLQLTKEGRTQRDIARSLQVSVGTVNAELAVVRRLGLLNDGADEN